MNIVNPQNKTRGNPVTMRTLLYSLLREYGLPYQVLRRIENAEVMITASNALHAEYITISRWRHTAMGHHKGWMNCTNEVCVASRRILTQWEASKRHHRRGLVLVKKLMGRDQ